MFIIDICDCDCKLSNGTNTRSADLNGANSIAFYNLLDNRLDNDCCSIKKSNLRVQKTSHAL